MPPITKMRIHRSAIRKSFRPMMSSHRFRTPAVLVAVDAASVNPVDFKIRSGKYPAVKDDRLPHTLGRDFSGIVEKCGAQATRFKPGDEVFGMVNIYGGGYSEKVVVDEWAIALKPAGMDHVHAAAIPLAGQTTWQGLFRHGGLKAGQTVLIHGGSGGVGHYAIQFAKAEGARVLTTVSTGNVPFARELGTDVIIDYKRQRFEDEASGLDMVFDLIDGETRKRSWKLLKKGGVLVTTLTDPSQEKAREYGVRALRYTVEADGSELGGNCRPRDVRQGQAACSEGVSIALRRQCSRFRGGGAFHRQDRHDSRLRVSSATHFP
jgi:NADPH:quinone reductase-like Zn-dependent oxidoreductase